MSNNMTPFTDMDWDCFAGCEGENPHIGYFVIDGQDYTVVTDDAGVEISWHVSDDACPDHFARKDWNELERTTLTLNFFVMYGNGILNSINDDDTIQGVLKRCGLEQCQ